MKCIKAILISGLCVASFAQAESSCHQGMQSFFNKNAPTTQTVTVTGMYTKKGELSGEYKACEMSVALKPWGLSPIWDAKKFDSTNGDGGSMWPFAEFPTSEPNSSEDRNVYSFSCNASDSEIETSFSYRDSGGWRKKHSTALSISKNSEGTYDLTIATDGFRSESTCRGNLSGK